MSELSCDTPFIGRNETHDLIRYRLSTPSVPVSHVIHFHIFLGLLTTLGALFNCSTFGTSYRPPQRSTSISPAKRESSRIGSLAAEKRLQPMSFLHRMRNTYFSYMRSYLR